MRPPSRSLPALFVALAACGSRTPLELPEASVDAGFVDASREASTDALLADTTAESAPPDAAPCSWTLGPATMLTDGTQDWALESVAVGPQGVLVGVQVSDADPPHDRAWRARLVDFDAQPAAPLRAVLSQPAYGDTYAGLCLAPGAAAAWDPARGLQLVPLSADASPMGTVARATGQRQCSLFADAEGFSLLSSDAAATALLLERVDSRARLTGERIPLVPFEAAGAVPEWTRVALPSGDFLLGTQTGDASARTLAFTRYSSHGVRRGQTHALAGFVRTARLRLVSDGASLWAGVAESDPRGIGVLALLSLSADGTPQGMPVSIAPTRPTTPYAWTALAAGGRLVLLWAEGTQGLPSRLRMLTVSPDLASWTDPVTLAQVGAGFGSSIVLRDTPRGPVLVYEAEDAQGQPMQVWSRTLRCS